MTNTNIKSPADVSRFQVFADGSGAEALISYRGYVFACNHLGRPSMTLIKPVSGTRVENRIAVDVCRKAYAELIALNCDAAWLALNTAMYPDADDEGSEMLDAGLKAAGLS